MRASPTFIQDVLTLTGTDETDLKYLADKVDVIMACFHQLTSPVCNAGFSQECTDSNLRGLNHPLLCIPHHFTLPKSPSQTLLCKQDLHSAAFLVDTALPALSSSLMSAFCFWEQISSTSTGSLQMHLVNGFCSYASLTTFLAFALVYHHATSLCRVVLDHFKTCWVPADH